MIETAVHIAKRRNPSGKTCYTVRWLQDGHYRGHACGGRDAQGEGSSSIEIDSKRAPKIC